MNPRFQLSSRSLLIVFVIALVFIAGAVGLQNYVTASLGEPTPTRLASAVAVVLTDTATPTQVSLPATNTPIPSRTNTHTPGPSPTPSRTPTITPTPSITPTPTPSPTSRPQFVPTIAFIPTDETPAAEGTEMPTPSTPIPTAVPTFEVPANTTNILLLGSDTDLDEGVGRTDTMIIVAINRDGPTASMVSLPRDLYVYIPGWEMNRINTALGHGSAVGYPGGAVAQLKDTILYNFGIPIHYYAQVDFEGFQRGVDIMGGVDIAVSCELRDWRLISPDLDPQDEDSWEMFTLAPGIHMMDGDLALWYARSRRTTSDFHRGRRQQQLLRAMLNQAVDLNMIGQVPELWDTYKDTVRTDLDIGRILQLASLAPAIRENGVQNLYIVGDQLQPWTEPVTQASVQLPIWENIQKTLGRLFLPPTLNRAYRPPITVEVVNASGNPDMGLLAADNLEWYGFVPVVNESDQPVTSETKMEYFGQNLKGSFDWLLSWIFKKDDTDIQLVTDTPYQYDYRVTIGTDYDPCLNQLVAP
ncbi:MAG: LCP family protein [Candidatus Promineifilaceae bacterium]